MKAENGMIVLDDAVRISVSVDGDTHIQYVDSSGITIAIPISLLHRLLGIADASRYKPPYPAFWEKFIPYKVDCGTNGTEEVPCT